MDKKLAAKFLLGYMLIQHNIIGTKELPLDATSVNVSIIPLDATKVNISIVPDDGQRLWLPKELKQLGDNYFNDIKSMPRYLYIRPKMETNHTSYNELKTLYLDLETRRIMHVVDAHQMKTLCCKAHMYGALDLIFMLSILIVFCFHIFFLDAFIRFTRRQFENSTRFLLLSHINRLLTFLTCVGCVLLLLMHYRDNDM